MFSRMYGPTFETTLISSKGIEFIVDVVQYYADWKAIDSNGHTFKNGNETKEIIRFDFE